ncbi:MAG: CAP domain-containing protein [Candidatus Competibacter sp.]|nr:CAP domain-containing protein [Candidatus Competibacter sp.]MDG4583408.1 CAP domain-containing protein [Candidatus Competibacter sp.]
MGRATILSGGTDGLYTIRPEYNNAPLDKLIADLTAAKDAALPVLGRATLTLSLLEDETEIARAAMNQVINQWQQDLLNAGNPPPLEPPTEDDPETGMPWDPSDKAQEGPLFDAINAARAAAGKAALTRDDDLDFAARRQVYDMSGSKLMGHVGSDKSVPSSRVAATGYQADLVVELLSCGAFTAASAVNVWTVNGSYPIFSDVATQIGVAYTYSTNHPATHIWVALLAHPDPDPDPSPPTITYPDDPAQKTAREQEAGLEKIEPPKTEVTTPEKLGEVVRKFGIAAAKEAAARRELARLLAEYDSNVRKLNELEALKTAHDAASIEAWCADLSEEIAASTLVDTFEPPGYRDGDAIHIAPYESDPHSWDSTKVGQLRYAATLNEAQVFVNLAMEAGHLKWRPLWRYGIITDIQSGADTCNLTLEAATSRGPAGALSLNETANLATVPVVYMNCNSAAFEVGDRVIVLYEGQDRTQPKVIGFADHPRDCGGWIESFDAAVYDLGANDPTAWASLIVPSGDGWPISNTVPYLGAPGIRFQEWAGDQYWWVASGIVRANWPGGQFYSNTVDDLTTTAGLSVFMTGSHHKMIVVDVNENSSNSAYVGDGSLLLSYDAGDKDGLPPRRHSYAYIFPDDCQDFLVDGEASFDFPIWLDWDKLEVQFTVTANPSSGGAGLEPAWLKLFFWAGFSLYDFTISGQRHLGLYGVSDDGNPLGTSMAFCPFELGDYSHGDSPMGQLWHDRYLSYTITHNYDHYIWSNNNPSPYDLGWAHAPSGWRYYCVYDPSIKMMINEVGGFDGVSSAINGRHTFKTERSLIDPDHTIDCVQIAAGGLGAVRLHSVRFYKAE